MSEYSDEELMRIIREGAEELGLTRILPMKTIPGTETTTVSEDERAGAVFRLVQNGR